MAVLTDRLYQKNYLPLVWISIASTSSLFIRSAVVRASLTYVTSPVTDIKCYMLTDIRASKYN